MSINLVLAATSSSVPTVTIQQNETSTGQTIKLTVQPTDDILPESTTLNANAHEYQQWNNCGPATLSMGLRHWGWQGTQEDTAPWLKPDRNDKNVAPAEMQTYVNTHIDSLQLLYRAGGNLNVLRTLISAGYPVIVEKGFQPDEEKGWMGHYLLLTGYDDGNLIFTSQDSYSGPNVPVGYAELDADWQAFNRMFIVIYPEIDQEAVLSLLGDRADETHSYELALETGRQESIRDPNNAFAWHNLGSSLGYFGEYRSAAAAFDQARAIGLAWRMLWYQTEMYQAYFNVGRYNDVVNLASSTLDRAPNLEESYFWRASAHYALGDVDGAIADFRKALEYNANFEDAKQALYEIVPDS
jgi:tetratricopeptide (TPR) repeat protein